MTAKFTFHHIALKCSDLEKSLSMYKALGMEEVLAWGEGDKRIVMLDIGDGRRMELFANGSDEFSPNGKWIHLALGAEDVDAAYASALAAGFVSKNEPKVLPILPDKSIHIAFVYGPDGEIVEFFREV